MWSHVYLTQMHPNSQAASWGQARWWLMASSRDFSGFWSSGTPHPHGLVGLVCECDRIGPDQAWGGASDSYIF